MAKSTRKMRLTRSQHEQQIENTLHSAPSPTRHTPSHIIVHSQHKTSIISLLLALRMENGNK